MKFPKYKTVKLDEEDKAHHEEAEQEEKKAAEEQSAGVFLGASYPHGRLDVEVFSLPSSFSCSCSSSSSTRQML